MMPTSIGGGSLRLHVDLEGTLATSRNLLALLRRLPTLHDHALGTLARRLPVQARRDIQSEYRIGARRVNQDLSARVTSDGVRLVGRFRGIGLLHYGARPTRRGVSATVFHGRRDLRLHAFIRTGLSGNRHAFRREGPPRTMHQGRYAGKRRQPLVAEYAASVAQMLAKGRRPERLVDYARGVLASEAERLLGASTRLPPTGPTS